MDNNGQYQNIMSEEPEACLLLSEIETHMGFARYWERCRSSLRSRGFVMRDAHKHWRLLREEYYGTLKSQLIVPGTEVWTCKGCGGEFEG